MTNDTLKSLGFLKKSLKMNHRAMVNNLTADAIDQKEVLAFAGHSKAMFDQIEAWEKANGTAAVSTGGGIAVIPAGIVQPAPAASTVSTVSIVPNPDDDLLTVP